MQKNLINYTMITLYFCIPFFLKTECKLTRIRGKRQLDPYIQYSNFASQFPTIYPSFNSNPCINLEVNDRPCLGHYFSPQYYPQQTPANIIGSMDNSPIWPNWPLLFPQFLPQEQQHSGYQLFWPYNYQQSIPSLPPAQPINNEPQTTLPDQTTNKSKKSLGSTPGVINPETSSDSHQFDYVQNEPIRQNYQVVKTSSSLTIPKTLNIVRSYTDSHEVPEISIQDDTSSQTSSQEESEDPPDSPVNNHPKEENRQTDEERNLYQTTEHTNQEKGNQKLQQNAQQQENIVVKNSEIRDKEKNRRRQNRLNNDGENEDEYYYEYLH
ncbi:myb-like protein X [Agrilus planipennis]|uniref:Myb-like protein X n=1 Tax=Agrilus planipennis TaxID=224129 RepID=A0A1W4WD01_AGRPL|nr:myb-like protein X [Agrilus planipennis]